MFRTKRLVMMMALSTLMVLSALVAVPATSHASACGYEYWNPHIVKDIPIPSGQLTHCISGEGYFVSWDGADFLAAGNLCDTTMRFSYGYNKSHFDGGLHRGCSHVGAWKYSLGYNVPGGDACAELWQKNWRILVARQCHYVS